MKNEEINEQQEEKSEFAFPKTGLIIMGVIAVLMIFCIVMICIL